MKKQIQLTALRIILSAMFVIGFNQYFFQNHTLGNESIINLFLLMGAYYLLKHSETFSDKRLLKQCGIFCTFLTTTLWAGRLLYYQGNLYGLLSPILPLVLNILSVLGVSSILSVLLTMIVQSLLSLETKLDGAPWKIYKHPWIYSLLIFLSWIPCYLAYYPGVAAYDLYDQTLQALGTAPITRFHPPLHTFFWKLCISAEGVFGIGAFTIYGIVQMTLLSVAFGYVVRFLIRQKINNWIILAAIIFFCFHPCIAVFSSIPVKDAMFAAFFVLYTVELFTFLGDKEKYLGNIFCNARLVLFAILCCLLRNNMIYALVPATIAMILLLRQYWKPIFLWFACIFLGYTLVNGPLYSALGVGPGNTREMLSVPIQQIAYVVTKYETVLAAEDIAVIDNYLPVNQLGDRYNPRFADSTKETFRTEAFEEDALSFIKIWFKLLLQYPMEYVESFLNLNLPYWYADACSYDSYSERKYIETTTLTDFSLSGYEYIADSKIPKLYSIYQILTNFMTYKNVPIVSNLFSIGTPIWVLLLGIFLLKIKKHTSLILPLLPAVFLWFTFLLGPVSNFRYMFPIFVLYPMYLAAILQPNRFVSSSSVSKQQDALHKSIA